MSSAVRRYPLAIAGAAILVLAVAAAALAPHLPLPDPDTVDTPNRLRPPLSPRHLLGTDEFGRDLMSRLVWGARVSLLAGVGTAGLAMLVGVVLGVLGGYYTGWIEAVVMRLTDILMAFPYILLAIAIVAGLGPGLRNAMIAIAIVGFPLYTRLVRGVVLSVKQLEFVEAARALGSSDATILVRHVLPQFVSRHVQSRRRRQDPRHRGPVVPRSRHTTAHRRLGQHARHRTPVRDPEPARGAPARPRDLRDRLRRQPRRRRPPRRARPQKLGEQSRGAIHRMR
jgi:hypothetical protein